MKAAHLFLALSLFPGFGAYAFEPFVDPLVIPPSIVVPPDQTDLTIHMRQFTAKFHRDLPARAQFGYEGMSPGPTIEVNRDQRVNVHWVNDLPDQHVLARPKDAMNNGVPDVATVVHLHGAVVEQPNTTDKLHDNDGWPDLWFTHGAEQIAAYGNPQSARTLWYHDHAMGTTGRNVSAGLLGTYLIHDDLERSLNLPSGKYDIPLLLQPKKLKDDGSLAYEDTITKEHYGNAFFVNGVMYPYLDVEPRKYRFRVINASNARSVGLKLIDLSDLASPGPAFHQIGNESGFLADTVTLNDPSRADSGRLLLMPAERADIVIDFSEFAGRTFILHNNLKPDDTDGVVPLYQIMQFRVGTRTSSADTSRIPTHIRDVARLDPASAVRSRRITFEQMDMGGMPMLTHNGKMWHDPIDDYVTANTTEIWELVDTLPDGHPFHMHLADFQVLDRRPFDVEGFVKTGNIRYTGDAIAPLANEMSWKDTVRVSPGHVTRIIAHFGPILGHYVYHCHILEHEDMDMMRPFDVVPAGDPHPAAPPERTHALK